MNKVTEYLTQFATEAEVWFGKKTFIFDHYKFFKSFFMQENLAKAEWSDFQQLRKHLHCFQKVALAGANALGKPNHPVEHYRKSFIFLAHGPGVPAERIRRFASDPEYRLDYFGGSAISELAGYLFPEDFVFKNTRDIFAVKFLGLVVDKHRGDDLVAELEAFSKATRPVAAIYQQVVGQQTALPINFELDQFFSWVYEKFSPDEKVPVDQATAAPATGTASSAPLAGLHLSQDAETEAYDKNQAMQGLFLSEARFDEMLAALKEKKNLVLRGAPGVGKTYVAKRLARAFIGSTDPRRVETIQFHQSYSYEDFILGYRPAAKGQFALRHGIFHQFCHRAQRDEAENKPYIFIVDEINRGNLSKIFGELMMLIEPDKRGKEHAIPLAYSEDGDEKFYLPENLHIIGTMNTADRSLAMVDYALRRRFRFIKLRPEYSSDAFTRWLAAAGASRELVTRIIDRMTTLNKVIADAKDLGPDYEIGHSFFCPAKGVTPDDAWYRRVVEEEIVPLVEEYWFDNAEQVSRQRATLLD